MTPARPMLGAVLDVLVNSDGREVPSWWLANRVAVVARANAHEVIIEARGHFVAWPWRTTDPAEALELLQARDLVPLDCRARLICEGCSGTGGAYVGGCHVCDATGHRPHPSTVAALASWASLGWWPGDGCPGIAGAEEWAREVDPGAQVLWRVRELRQTMDAPSGTSAADRLRAAGIVPVDPGLTRRAVTLYVPPLGA